MTLALPMALPSKDVLTGGISILLHLAFFVSTGMSFDSAKFSVDSGLSSLEIHMVASAAKTEVVEISLADNTESDFIVEKKKKKVKENVVQKTTVADGKSMETVQTEKGGAISEAKPEYLKNPAPVYPALAKNKGQQGLVQILVDVNSDGSVKHVLLKKSSGFLLLDDAAVRAVKHWQFMPASQNGVQIESQVEVPIRFQLAKNGNSDIVVH
ncbi:MAG: protein TonB [Pseudobdellovibrio sp.]|jgi:protein TonB|nr:protein TonB [Pseudobdellovibrio sp.]